MMRKLLARSLATLALLLVAVAPTLHAQAQSGRGELRAEILRARSLQGNLAGNDEERSVLVYLPPGYVDEPERRYPTIYLLSGIADANTAWTEPWNDRNPGYATIPELMDAGVAEGVLQPMIVVIPDARTRFPGSFYTNSPVSGYWEDFVAEELVAWVDGNFRSLARADARGIAGHSMGAHGAIKIAMRHPDTFQVVYGMNPAVMGWGQDVSEENPAFAKVLDPGGPELDSGDPYVFAIVGIAQSWSPNPDRPPFFADFPFELRDGKVAPSEPAHAAWTAEMPLHMVDLYAENLKKLRALRFDSAFVDEYPHIPPTSKAFSDALVAHGIRHRFEMYNGDHRNRLWGRMGRLYWDVLPYFSRLLTRG